MYEINTIADFEKLPQNLRDEVLKAIRAKDKLDEFLKSQNKKQDKSPEETPETWIDCPKCTPGGKPGLYLKKGKEKRDNSDIHPSQIDKCIKNLYYSCAGYADQLEEHIDPRVRRIFDLGHAWHNIMQNWYGKGGAWCAPEHYHDEVRIDPDAKTFDGKPALPIAEYYWIKGSVDAIITRCELQVPGLGDVAIRLVHEYKTMKSTEYDKLTRPKPEHKKQATIYSAVFDIPVVVYLYLNKDNSQMADFPVAFDHTIWQWIVEKCEKVKHYVNTETLPPWEETSASKNPRECMDCGYRKICQPPLKQLGR